MMSLFNQVKQAYLDLSVRDRQILTFSLPVIAVLALYLLVYQPINTRHMSAIAQLDTASDDYYWLRSQQQKNTEPSRCGPNAIVAEGKDYLEQQAKKLRLSVIVKALAQGQFEINIASGNGRIILRYLHSIGCKGHNIHSLNIGRKEADGDKVKAKLIVSDAVGNK